ncbi:FecCD family ABC transporter permease [Haloarcula amylolytica]|uniref:Cobalamin import system permease protein BtuC n=1 Tax=Haloarcula amylolytica JCM 13557 TaxID=1227452 RepID=M0K290_9EURY|nr:iron ABC transporter permease [Haloarcula amylolytica]EMA13970.1 transporter permease [Haloarcula amylolytica JCM 13557]
MASHERTTDKRRFGLPRVDWIDRSLIGLIGASFALTVAAGLVQISFGAYGMSVIDAWRLVFDLQLLLDPMTWQAFILGGELPQLSQEAYIVWTIRVPRVLVALFVGMNLAVSGGIFQAVTRNELASPYILGVSSGAGLAIMLTVVFFTGLAPLIPVFASVGGIVSFLLVYTIAWKGGTSPVRLVLAGVIVGTVLGSVQQGLFFMLEDIDTALSAMAWMTGSLTGTDWEQVRMILPWTVVSVGLALVTSRQLNVLLLGEKTASSLGMPVERIRFGLSVVAVVAAAASVAAAGLIGFVGLIVPHMVRNIVGSDYKRLTLGCLFVGPALILVADTGARLLMSPNQVPVGIITGLIGGPYFLYLMRKKHNMGEI